MTTSQFVEPSVLGIVSMFGTRSKEFSDLSKKLLFVNELAGWPKCIACLPEANRWWMITLETASLLFVALCPCLVLCWKDSVVLKDFCKCITCLPEADGLRKTALQTESSLFALCLFHSELLSWENPVVYYEEVVVVHNRLGWPVWVCESFFRRPVLRMTTLRTAPSFYVCIVSMFGGCGGWCVMPQRCCPRSQTNWPSGRSCISLIRKRPRLRTLS